jgi:FHS family L-fucose permease-like MFS transporter
MAERKHSLVKHEYILPFVLVTALFFMWGFARSILDVLNKHFQDTLNISMTESAMIQVTTYLAYFAMAIPAGMYITRCGYRRGVVFGLLLFGIGSLLFIPGELIGSFYGFLVALFVVGCGLVFLETAANPYITRLGDPATGAGRLNLAQSFNGLGCIIAPALVAPMLFVESGEASVSLPYSIMGVAVLAIAMIFCRVKLPEINNKTVGVKDSPGSALRFLLTNSGFMLGVSALFFYEISEISINSFFINYVTADEWLTPSEGALVLSLGGLGIFMLARVIGSLIMTRIAAEKVLTICAIGTVIGAAAVTLEIDTISKIGLFMCYAFEAIMFPTIFAITVRHVEPGLTKMASSILMMTPVGGAVGTLLMGFVADATTISIAFLVPLVGYIVVLCFAISVWRARSSRH